MQNLLNVVMRRAGTDQMGKPLAPKVAIVLADDSRHELMLESAGPSAVMCRTADGQEMLIPYTSIKYIMP